MFSQLKASVRGRLNTGNSQSGSPLNNNNNPPSVSHGFTSTGASRDVSGFSYGATSTLTGRPTISTAPQLPALSGSPTLEPSSPCLSDAPVFTDTPEDDACPVCLESLSLKLQGEKPHVNPVCGHKLHHSCFEVVYGTSANSPRGSKSLGVCGVCRREMIVAVGEGTSSKNKLASMIGTGVNELDPFSDFSPANPRKSRASHDPDLDDPLLSGTFNDSESTVHAGRRPTFTTPTVKIISEQSSVVSDEASSHTCLVSISVGPRSSYGGVFGFGDRSDPFSASSGSFPSSFSNGGSSVRGTDSATLSRPLSPTQRHSVAESMTSAMSALSLDLFSRVQTDNNFIPASLGPLLLVERALVKKAETTRDFLIYLFEQAILCVDSADADDENQSVPEPNASPPVKLKGCIYVRHIRGVHVDAEQSSLELTLTQNQSITLLLRSSESVKRWRSTIERLAAGRQQGSTFLSPTNDYGADLPSPTETNATLSNYITTRPSSVYTRTTTASTVASDAKGYSYSPTSSTVHGSTTNGHASPGNTDGRTLGQNGPSQTNLSPSHSAQFSQYSSLPSRSFSSGTFTSEDPSACSSSPLFVNPFKQTTQSSISPSASYEIRSPTHSTFSSIPSLNPISTGLDLLLVFSVPTDSHLLSQLQHALSTTLSLLSPPSRVSLVAFRAAPGTTSDAGYLRKTPLIALGSANGPARLAEFIAGVGVGVGNTATAERVNVLSAVNVALDVLLQRKQKNALAGLVLVHCAGADRAARAQMELAMTRTDVASLPVHTVGWGPAHDPSALWVLSNHSGGTYTYAGGSLAAPLAGAVAALASVALTSVRVRLTVPDERLFRIRKVSGASPTSIVLSTEGHHAEISIPALAYGETRELLVEIDKLVPPALSMSPMPSVSAFDALATAIPQSMLSSSASTATDRTRSNATQSFFLASGLSAAILHDDDNAAVFEYDTLPEDATVLDVNVAYIDPAAGKSISRLFPETRPNTLSMTVLSRRGAPAPEPPACPEIISRRIQLLVADMLTRFLVQIVRRNVLYALRLLDETSLVITTLKRQLVPAADATPEDLASFARARAVLSACGTDLQYILDHVRPKKSSIERSKGTGDRGHAGDRTSDIPGVLPQAREALAREHSTREHNRESLSREHSTRLDSTRQDTSPTPTEKLPTTPDGATLTKRSPKLLDSLPLPPPPGSGTTAPAAAFALDPAIRNFVAQQSNVLRDQRACTHRTATETLFSQADMIGSFLSRIV